MAKPLSPNHVFNFLADNPVLDLEDDPVLDVENDTKKDPEEEKDMDIKEDILDVFAPHAGSPPISRPPISQSLSSSDSVDPITVDRTFWVPTSGSTFEIRGPSSVSSPPLHLLRHVVRRLKEDNEILYGSVRTLTQGMETCQTEIATTRTGSKTGSETVEIQRLRAQVESTEVSATLAAMDKELIKRELYWIRGWFSRLQLEITRRGAIEARPTESINVLAVYEDSQPFSSQGPPDGLQ
uniref:Uncharacterized protein n=1 Tax=Tanacetum cinerariifolium TaxID=118510 RepID=A0A699HK67_TANCI|nr:hypothetical protein [Tanacetum cinerariifolium]GEY32037.1 hypothetical protein [Tanacetum cinerariifolium]